MIFASSELEHQFREHWFAVSRYKYDILASLFSSLASLSFYTKATLEVPPADATTSILFLILVTSKAIPLIAILYLGQASYLVHRTKLMCAVSVCRYDDSRPYAYRSATTHAHSIIPYLMVITMVNVATWPCELVKSLTGEALGGSLAVALLYQLPFDWHLPIHGVACATAAAAICMCLCNRALPTSSACCTELSDAVTSAARVINYVVNVFVLPFAEWNDSVVRRPCVAVTIMIIFNLGFVLPSCVLYFLETMSRHAFAAARGLPTVSSGALGLWLFDPLPLIGSLVYANCGLWLYVRLFESI